MPCRKNEWSDLQQRIYLKFYVKLGNNASDTCAMLSEAYEGEAMKMSGVSQLACRNHKWRQCSSRFFDIKIIVHFEFIPQGQWTELIMWKYRSSYVKLCVDKGLNFAPTIGFSTMTMLRITRCSLSSSLWPKNRLLKWNTRPVSLMWLPVTSSCF
jgi:hypothetical protein